MVQVFKIHKFLFKFFGIYLEGNGRIISKFQVGMIVALSLVNGFGTIAGMIFLNSNFADRLIALESAFVSGLGATKVVMFHFSCQSVAKLMSELGDFKADTPTNRTVNRVVKAYTASMTGVPIFWIINALLSSEHRSTPMPWWIPFEVDSSSKFIPVFTLGSVALFALCYTNTIVDTAILMLISQLCTRLLVLRFSIEKLGKKIQPTSKHQINQQSEFIDTTNGKYKSIDGLKLLKRLEFNEYTDYVSNFDEIYGSEVPRLEGIELIEANDPMKLLTKCIKHHNKTMELVLILGKLLHVIFFFQVFLSLFLSCISIFAVTLIEDASKDGVKFIPIFCAQYIQYFIYCWIGEQLTIHCEKVRESAYCSHWYECKPKVRKSLFLLLEYTKKSYVFRGCYIFSMSHQTFLRIIQESLSYFMFLRTFVSKT